MRKLVAMGVMSLGLVLMNGCTDADVASRNLAEAAENFELDRRIVFYNGITNEYILSIEGKCSIEDRNRQLAVTCKDGSTYKKHHLGLSDNVTYFSEQLNGKIVGTSSYRVTFKPSVIIPDIRFK